jgi:uncharacterized lipoprotein YmbA
MVALSSPLQVDAVHLPALLDRNAIIRQTGANTVSVSQRDRWTAPLDDMVQDVVTQDLAERAPPGDVILPNSPAPPDVLHPIVNLTQFQEAANQVVHLEGSWMLVAGQRILTNQKVRLTTVAADSKSAAQAAAMSRLLAELDDQILSTLSPHLSEK